MNIHEFYFCVKMLDFFLEKIPVSDSYTRHVHVGKFCGNRFTFTLMLRPGCERVFKFHSKNEFCPSQWE